MQSTQLVDRLIDHQFQQSHGTTTAVEAASGDTARSYVFAAWWHEVFWARNVQIGVSIGISITALTGLPFSSLYASNSPQIWILTVDP